MRQDEAVPGADPGEAVARREACRVLDAELQALPGKYRAPLVLCCLQGLTNAQAARQLGRAPGSMSKLLARGRELLRLRLVRRGVDLSATTLAAVLADAACPAAVPDELFPPIVSAAGCVAAGGAPAAAPDAVSTLAEGVIQTMKLTRLKLAGLFLLGLTVAGSAGAGLWARANAQRTPPSPAPAEKAAEPAPKHPIDAVIDQFRGGDPAFAKLLDKETADLAGADPKKRAKEKTEVARTILDARLKDFLIGRGTQTFLLQAADHLLRAEVAASADEPDSLAAYERCWKLARLVEYVTRARFEAGRVPVQDDGEATFFRMEAEQRWLEARAASEKKPKN